MRKKNQKMIKKIKKLKMCINKKLKNFNCKKKNSDLLIRFIFVVFRCQVLNIFQVTILFVGSCFFSTNYVNCSELSLFLNDSMFM